MNVRMLAPTNVTAAAVVIGGALIAAVPWHAPSVVRLVVLTAAAAVALHAVARVVPERTATVGSPFARTAPRDASSGSGDLDRIRARLTRRRQPIADGVWLPAETVRLLQPLIRAVLEREGASWADDRLSPPTRAVLTAEPVHLPDWWRTRRGSAWQVAEIVHEVVDDLDRLSTRGPVGGWTTGGPAELPSHLVAGRRGPSRHEGPT